MSDPVHHFSSLPVSSPIVVSGLGMVTPLGWETEKIWKRLCAGENGIQSRAQSTVTGKTYRCARMEGFNLDDIIRTGRVRRSSPISHFAVGAAELALRDARLTPRPRLGVIVAVSMGGVNYSRGFHAEFVKSGGRNTSPMLFPETVFNAPASHIAAVFGLTDVNYTIIGDACGAANAITMAVDLIATGMLDQCLVVGSEEFDWIVIEAFRRFRIAAPVGNETETMRPFDRNRNGFVSGEGAVAVLLESGVSAEARNVLPRARLLSCDRGFPFRHRSRMPRVLGAAIQQGLRSANLEWPDMGGAICSANGTFVDGVEAAALAGTVTGRASLFPITSVKHAMGEAHAASCMLQFAVAALAVQHRMIPPTVGTRDSILDTSRLALVTGALPIDRVNLLVLSVGFNEQVSVAILGGHES